MRLKPAWNKFGFRAQLTFIFGFFIGITLIAYSSILYKNFSHLHLSEFDSGLVNYAVDITNSLRITRSGQIRIAPELFQENAKIFPFPRDKILIQLRVIPSGVVIVKSSSLGGEEIPFDPLSSEGQYFEFSSRENKQEVHYRGVNYFINIPTGDDYLLQVASPLTPFELDQKGLLIFFLLSIPLTILISSMAVYAISSKAISPIKKIIQKTREITANQLNERVPVPKVFDEVAELAVTLNGLLNRLEASFQSQEAFAVDASHQMKTPLAILKGEIEILQKDLVHFVDQPDVTQTKMEQFLKSAAQEITSLSRTIEQLLALARLNSGYEPLAFGTVSFDEVAIDVSKSMKRHQMAKEKNLTIEVHLSHVESHHDDPFTIRGDYNLLKTMLENLVNNSIKYAPENSIIKMSLKGCENSVYLEVQDEGPGVPEADRKKVFERFYTRGSGSGVGLHIVEKIASAHGGRTWFASGSCICVEILRELTTHENTRPIEKRLSLSSTIRNTLTYPWSNTYSSNSERGSGQSSPSSSNPRV